MEWEIFVVFMIFGFTPNDGGGSFSIGLAPIPIGSCSKGVTLQEDFNITAFLGIWYEDRFLHKSKVTGDGYCGIIDFSKETTSGVIKATYRDMERTLSGELSEAQPGASGAKLQLTLNVPEEKTGEIKEKTLKYYVVDTDYNCYALIHGCMEYKVLHDVAGWILVRDFDCLDDDMFYRISEIAEKDPNWIFSEFDKTNSTICPEEEYENLGYSLKRNPTLKPI